MSELKRSGAGGAAKVNGRGLRLLVGVGAAALALTMTACGSSDEHEAPSSANASSSATTSSASAAPSSSKAASSETSTAQQTPTSEITLPSQGTAETVASPSAGPEEAYLKALREKGISLNDEMATSVGNSVCRMRKTSSEDAAKQFASAVMKADTGKQPSDEQVSALVKAAGGLC